MDEHPRSRRELSDREVKLERVRDLCRVRNELAQLRMIEEYFVREQAASRSAEVDDVIDSARQSIRKHEAHVADLLRGRA